MSNITWNKSHRVRGDKESVYVYTLSVGCICCTIEKGRKDNYIFTIWDGGAIKTSFDFGVSLLTLEEAKSFCEKYVTNNTKSADNLDESNNPLKIKSFETIIDEIKKSYKDDVYDTREYVTGEEFESWLKDRKRYNKES